MQARVEAEGSDDTGTWEQVGEDVPAVEFAGDFTKAEIRDRLNAVIDISREHADYFVRNLIAVRCEERLALLVFRASAFLYGIF